MISEISLHNPRKTALVALSAVLIATVAGYFIHKKFFSVPAPHVITKTEAAQFVNSASSAPATPEERKSIAVFTAKNQISQTSASSSSERLKVLEFISK